MGITAGGSTGELRFKPPSGVSPPTGGGISNGLETATGCGSEFTEIAEAAGGFNITDGLGASCEAAGAAGCMEGVFAASGAPGDS